jgi:RNA polymerase sigma-70 factor (ECF subfamily)
VPTDLTQEQGLIQRAQAGDTDAVAQLYERHAPAIFRYLFFRVHDRATAEDLTGEVFVKVVEALPRYVDRGLPFAAWLFRIAHDRAVDHHRRSAYRDADALSDQLPAPDASTEDEAFGAHESAVLFDHVRFLTDDQQLVIHLRFVEGYNLEETAKLMSKTPGAIKALQHRALRQLARRLER